MSICLNQEEIMLVHKRFLLLVAFAILLVTAGCTETQENSQLKVDASASITAAQQSINTSADTHDALEKQLSTAKEKGVRSKNASQALENSENDIQAARQSMSAAQRAFEDGEYEDAASKAKKARENAKSAKNALKSVQPALKKAYKRALDRVKPKVQSANTEYRIAVAYINAAGEIGADTSDLQINAKETSSDLKKAVTAIQNQNPKQARKLALQVNQSSHDLQQRAIEAGEKGEATSLIQSVDADLKTNASPRYLKKANIARNNGDLDRVETLLYQAQQAEQLALYQSHVEKVGGSTQLDSSLLQKEIEQRFDSINKGEEVDLENLRAKVDASRKAAQQISNADVTIQRAEKKGSHAYSVPIKDEKVRLDRARSAYADGNYRNAQKLATTVNESAAAEIKRANDYYEKDTIASWIFGGELFVSGLLGGDKIPAPTTFSQLKVISVDYSDISFTPPSRDSIKVERLAFDGSVALPSVKASSEPTGVEFALTEVDPSECGSTCRDVDATIKNTGDTTAHDVVVTLHLELNGDEIKTKTVEIGSLAPGESRTETKRIKFDYYTGAKIKSNGGVQAILKIKSDEHNQRITREISV